MKNNFLKKLLIVFFITVMGVPANGNSAKETKTVRVLNVDVKISIAQAKQLALDHSKVAKNTAKMTKIRLDKENKKIINTNGSDTEIRKTPKYIGMEKAKEIAVARITGAKKINVTNIQLDNEKGKMIYEGRIVYKNTEYKFDIDAITGEVINWEVNEN